MDKKILAIIAVIVVILVACGAYFAMGSSGDTVRIGHMQSDHDSALFVAKAQDQYAKNGINVQITQFNNGGDLMTAVAAGDIDVGYVGITPAMSSISKGVPVKVVSGAQTEGSGLVVDKDSNINSVADLKGKTVATPGAATIQQMLLTDVLNQNGMDIKDLKVTNLKAAQMVDAIKSNQIDAFIIWEPYSTIAVQSGEGKLLMNSSEIESGHPCCCIVATDDFIANHPDELDTILKIHENATNYINENPKEAAELLPDDIVPDREIQGQILENTNFISGLDDEYKQNVMDFMNLEVKLGVLEKPLTESQIFADL